MFLWMEANDKQVFYNMKIVDILQYIKNKYYLK